MGDDETYKNKRGDGMEGPTIDPEDFYLPFFDNFPGIAILTDTDMNLVFLRGDVTNITGYTEDDFLSGNMKWARIIHPDDLQRIMDRGDIERVLSTPDIPLDREHRIIRKDGETRWIHEIISTVPGEEEPIKFIQSIVFDITQRKEIEEITELEYRESLLTSEELKMAYEEMRKSQEDLARSEKTARIGTLADGIAHEINNPLQVIYGMAEIIMDEEDITEIKNHCRDILDAAERIKRIVHGLAHFSTKARTKNVDRIDLNEIIEDSIEMLKPSPKLYDVHLRVELSEIPEIPGNREELQQVIFNILHNALGAMEGSGDLSIVSRYEEKSVVILIEDTGRGIPDEDMEDIFVPFFTNEEVDTGTGLGLYLVHNIIKKYNGTIEIENREKKGTRVILKFPHETEQG